MNAPVQTHNITDPALQSVRDVQDAQAMSDAYFARLREAAANPKGGPRAGMRPSGRQPFGKPSMGQGTAAPNCPTDTRGSGSYIGVSPGGGRMGDPACDTPAQCGADILGFHSLGADGFPVAGPVAPAVIAQSPVLSVRSGNAGAFKPRYFFFEGRDPDAQFTVSPTLLISSRTAGVENLVSEDVANGITSSVFALTNEPLPVGWLKFSNTDQHDLRLVFGNYLAATDLHYFGVIWGDRVAG